MRSKTILVVSDIHFAAATERARPNYELSSIHRPVTRFLLQAYRRHVWLRDPLDKGYLLDRFLQEAPEADLVVANGDYSVDSAFVGVSDDASLESARACLEKLRLRFGRKFHAVFGDHELGKFSMIGRQGGLRLASWTRSIETLRLEPFWKIELGPYVLMAVTSSLVALPAYQPETLPEEWPAWTALREEHLGRIRAAFAQLDPAQRVILFCHDPTALPFLGRDETVAARLPQLECTVIGHLHSPLILWQSGILAGMPVIRGCGNTLLRLSTSLGQARGWKAFHPKLCPALAGIELLKDGGYLTLQLDLDRREPAVISRHRLRR